MNKITFLAAFGIMATLSPARSATTLESASFFSPMTFSFDQEDFRYMGMGLRQNVYARGEIVPGSAAILLEFLRAHNVLPGGEVVLDSPGGSLAEGMDIGYEIRQMQLNTEVGVQGSMAGQGECYSSCTLAFLGGVNRYIDPSSLFGVHQFSYILPLSGDQAFDFSQQISAHILNYITSMGVSPSLFSEMSVSDPMQINILSQDRLRALNVITPVYTTSWDLRAMPEGVYFRGVVQDMRGTHKFLIYCPMMGVPYPSMQALIEADSNSQDIVDTTVQINLVFDDREVPLNQNEIIQKPHVVNNDVAVGVVLTPRLISQLRTASTFGIELLPPSRQIFFGFTGNLSSGKTQLFDFLSSCRN